MLLRILYGLAGTANLGPSDLAMGDTFQTYEIMLNNTILAYIFINKNTLIAHYEMKNFNMEKVCINCNKRKRANKILLASNKKV